jgi:hypothetical protein
LKKPWVEALEGRVQDVKQRVEQRMEEAKQRVEAAAQRLSEQRSSEQRSSEQRRTETRQTTSAVQATPNAPLTEVGELPVVARLVVEIRSDGSRTLARGALEDVVTGERVAVEANGGSPAQLAASLAGNLLTTPFALGRYAKAVMQKRLRRGEGER